jgi:hypothetical protein
VAGRQELSLVGVRDSREYSLPHLDQWEGGDAVMYWVSAVSALSWLGAKGCLLRCCDRKDASPLLFRRL